MVVAVQANPVDWVVLAAQGAAGGKEALQPLGQAEGAVTEQAVVADGHAQAGGDPVENRQAGHGLPAPEHGQKCHHSKDVDAGHKANSAPTAAGTIAVGGLIRVRRTQHSRAGWC